MSSTKCHAQYRYEAISKAQNHEKVVSNTEFRTIIVWKNVVIFAILHLAAIYGMYRILFRASVFTAVYAYFVAWFIGFGITAGAHRLWSHRSYKATLPLQILLMLLNTAACQNCIIEWVRDHRVHHKFSETDADPHNAKRGFFFAHIGWLLLKKHPDVRSKGKGVDMSDVEEDPILLFQRKYYIPLVIVFWFIIPNVAPVLLWNETWTNTFFICTVWRYVLSLNFTWCVNSAAHLFGNKPYDVTINPAQNTFVSLAALGEGSHNYHHVFPWDYKADELGTYGINATTAFVDFFALFGWAYDRKTVSHDVIEKRVKRTGDGSHEIWGMRDKEHVLKET